MAEGTNIPVHSAIDASKMPEAKAEAKVDVSQIAEAEPAKDIKPYQPHRNSPDL